MAALVTSALVGRRVVDAADARALFAELADAALEECGFAYLDPEWRLLGVRRTPARHTNSAAVPLRDVVADVLALDATGVVMAHNHPAGDPTPSAADLAVTRRLAGVLDAIGARLIDHLVLAGDRSASMREMGLL